MFLHHTVPETHRKHTLLHSSLTWLPLEQWFLPSLPVLLKWLSAAPSAAPSERLLASLWLTHQSPCWFCVGFEGQWQFRWVLVRTCLRAILSSRQVSSFWFSCFNNNYLIMNFDFKINVKSLYDNTSLQWKSREEKHVKNMCIEQWDF